MKESLLHKLEALCARHEEIAGLLSDIAVINDQDRFRNLSMEYSQLEELVKNFNLFQQAQQALASAREMLDEDDAELRELAEEEVADSSGKIEALEVVLQRLLLPKDPNDNANVFLEIRAGTGGAHAVGSAAACAWRRSPTGRAGPPPPRARDPARWDRPGPSRSPPWPRSRRWSRRSRPRPGRASRAWDSGGL